ncbi:MAG: hypothetical protein Q7T87_16285 [Polaromonas sp.]|nr:hypothetical protein [Polaromonas sp.]
MATLEQYEQAKTLIETVEKQQEKYNGNNPDKYRTNVTQARIVLKIIEDDLKAQGLLTATQEEKLSFELSKLFPRAQSKDVVQFEGKRYFCKYTPFAKSLSGKSVLHWEKRWIEVTE